MNFAVLALSAHSKYNLTPLLAKIRAKGQNLAVLRLEPPNAESEEAGGAWGDRMSLPIAGYSDAAHKRVREFYPEALHDFALKTGLMKLGVWRNLFSVWWLIPISEMSSLRTELINLLYRLAIIEEAIKDQRATLIHLITDDRLFALAAIELASRLGVEIGFQKVIARRGRGPFSRRLGWLPSSLRRLVRLMAHFLARLLLVFVIKRLKPGGLRSLRPAVKGRFLRYTWFPVLWNNAGVEDRMDERQFFDTAEFLRLRGHAVAFAAAASFSWLDVLKEHRILRRQLKTNDIVLLESLLTYRDVFGAYLFAVHFWFRYRRWRRSLKNNFVFEGIDVTKLLLRELDEEITGDEMPSNLQTALGTARLMDGLKDICCAACQYEHQPRERAFLFGARMAKKKIPLVGIQTSMATINQMGYAFPKECVIEGADRNASSLLSPLPDLFVAYNPLIYELLLERVGSERVALAGALRYGAIDKIHRQSTANPNAIRASAQERLWTRYQLDPSKHYVLAALPSLRGEALRIWQLAVQGCRERQDLVLLVKFHYLCPLSSQVSRLAHQWGFSNYRVVDSDLSELLLASDAMATGTSSIGVEAIACGCMPIVFWSLDQYSISPLRDIADALFSFETMEEFRHGLDSTLARDREYEDRRMRWPGALARMLHQIDGRANERFYEFLQRAGVQLNVL